MDSTLFFQFNIDDATFDQATKVERRLADLRDCFADKVAYEEMLASGNPASGNPASGNPVVYTVASDDSHQGDGQLHFGLGMVMPGRVGAEYYMTKGHLHAWRPAAEVYIGLSGEGRMLLEGDGDGQTRAVSLLPNSVVYVPGYTVHRTVNVGPVPLVYLGVYPATAGHDYDSIAQRNFRKVIVERDGQPVVLDRVEFLLSLSRESQAQ